MATANAAATLAQADDFAADFVSSTLTFLDGVTVLATLTVPSFTTANVGADATATADAITAVTIAATGTCDSAVLSKGGADYTLTVGTSGTEVVLNSLSFTSGESCSVSSLVKTFPAS